MDAKARAVPIDGAPLVINGEPGPWAERARCRGMNSECFFARSIPDARDALRICRSCGVRLPCLRYALSEGIDMGVWGGMTERQRRAYARQQLAG